jgi:hypothetical protein
LDPNPAIHGAVAADRKQTSVHMLLSRLSLARAGALDGVVWDEAVVPMPQVERLILIEADVQRFSARRRVTTKAGRKRTDSSMRGLAKSRPMVALEAKT